MNSPIMSRIAGGEGVIAGSCLAGAWQCDGSDTLNCDLSSALLVGFGFKNVLGRHNELGLRRLWRWRCPVWDLPDDAGDGGADPI